MNKAAPPSPFFAPSMRPEARVQNTRPSWLVPPTAAENRPREASALAAQGLSLIPASLQPSHHVSLAPSISRIPAPPGVPGDVSQVPRRASAEIRLDLALEIERLQRENDALVQTVKDMTEQAVMIREQVVSEVEPQVVELAMAIAERVIGTELEAQPNLALNWAREGLQRLGGEDNDASVVVGPELGARMSGDEWTQEISHVRLVVDPNAKPFACEVRAGNARVDESAESRMAAVRAELTGS